MEGNRRAKSYVLLNESERTCLRENKFTAKAKSRLIEKLNRKISELNEDLNLITKRKALEVWRESAARRYWKILPNLANILKTLSSTQKPVYLDKIIKFGMGKSSKYWLQEVSFEDFDNEIKLKRTKKIYYSDRIFKPVNVLRGLKINEKDKKWLLDYYSVGYMPKKEKDALTINQIKLHRVKNESGVTVWKNPNEKKVTLSELKKKERERQESINKILDDITIEGNKILKKLDAKISRIQCSS